MKKANGERWGDIPAKYPLVKGGKKRYNIYS